MKFRKSLSLGRVLSGCEQRSRLRPAFTQPTAWRPITAGRALLPLQMLTNSPPPVARSWSFMLSLSSLGSLWPLWSDIQLIVLDDMNCVNMLFRLNIFNSLRQFSSKLQVLGQMYFSFKEKRLFTFYSIMDNIWKDCFFFFSCLLSWVWKCGRPMLRWSSLLRKHLKSNHMPSDSHRCNNMSFHIQWMYKQGIKATSVNTEFSFTWKYEWGILQFQITEA